VTVNHWVAGSSPACGATFYPNILIIWSIFPLYWISATSFTIYSSCVKSSY